MPAAHSRNGNSAAVHVCDCIVNKRFHSKPVATIESWAMPLVRERPAELQFKRTRAFHRDGL